MRASHCCSRGCRSPRGPDELDYEAEECAILEAAGRGGLDLVVEESGNPGLLAERLG